jgi:hypothetical protein
MIVNILDASIRGGKRAGHWVTGSLGETGSGFVALVITTERMKESRFIGSEMLNCDVQHIARTDQACLCISDATSALAFFLVEPLVHEIEIFATVVNLSVVVSSGSSILNDREVLRPAIAHARGGFRQMDRRIRVVTDSEQQHLSV